MPSIISTAPNSIVMSTSVEAQPIGRTGSVIFLYIVHMVTIRPSDADSAPMKKDILSGTTE